MHRKWLLGIGLLSIIAVVAFSGCNTATDSIEGLPSDLRISMSNQQEGIWVSGLGEIIVTPDIATLRLGVQAQAANVTTAQEQASAAMDKVMAALTDNGVAEKDIQTQYFNIRQITKWDRDTEEQVVTGYEITNSVTAKIRDIEKSGTIVDAVIAAGEDFIRIDNISFSASNPSDYYDDAREAAMADAKAKAELLADLAGGKLGNATYISESTPYSPPVYRQDVYEETAKDNETAISPGEIEINLTVQVVYSILY
ncbi:MAG: SIMPL domain-containing protein [Dehalococcoidales bacterium]|nr:SIMPL domain-containing protein [Dehalococcoidales bacterium]